MGKKKETKEEIQQIASFFLFSVTINYVGGHSYEVGFGASMLRSTPNRQNINLGIASLGVWTFLIIPCLG